MKRLKGVLTVTFPDGSLEICVLKDRRIKTYPAFVELIKETLGIILKNAPTTQGKFRINYRGDYATQIYDLLKTKEKQ